MAVVIRLSISTASTRHHHDASGTPSAVMVACTEPAPRCGIAGRPSRVGLRVGRVRSLAIAGARRGLLRGECCGTTASRPSNVPGQSSPGPGTSRSERRGVRAEPAVSLRGCQTPLHRSVGFPKTRSHVAGRSMINKLISQRSSRNLALPQAATSTTCCSFEMIRASFPTGVGKPGVFTLYMDQGTTEASVSSKDY